MKQILLLGATLLTANTGHADPIRFATFNASMARDAAGALGQALAGGTDPQIAAVAEIIQRTDPDVLLINEFDYDPGYPVLFRDGYLLQDQNRSGLGDPRGIDYPYLFVAPSNTGLATGQDLDNDGQVGGPGDAQGFGTFDGQYGMVVLSKFPIREDLARTFQSFRWIDMPDAQFPADPEDANGDGDRSSWYSDEEKAILRLSSKSHWDLPIEIDGVLVHFLVSHPTPPVFDGPEDRNGLRNAAEIRFWADYVTGEAYFYDDAKRVGGLRPETRFVIAGDLNADPFDGDSRTAAVSQLLDHPLINGSSSDATVTPTGLGGAEQAASQAGVNLGHTGNPAFDTADWGFAGPGKPDGEPGNLRVDYVLPSRFGLTYRQGGVVWPAEADPLSAITGYPTSDHRLVWIDVDLN